MSIQIAEQYFMLGKENDMHGVDSGIWKDLQDFGAGLNHSRDAFHNKENCVKIAGIAVLVLLSFTLLMVLYIL